MLRVSPALPIAASLAAAVSVLALPGSAQAAAAPPAARAKANHNTCPLPTFGPGSRYRARLQRDEMGPSVTNPYLPLPPGRTLVYSGVKDGKKAVNIFSVTFRTRVIDGVRTRVVEDRLYLDARLEERTSDYYAQDACGNVWYFGEDTATLDERGRVVSTDGSFRAGVHGAQPGVFMQAHPQMRRSFRQEWYAGQAEDVYRAVSRAGQVSVPYGRFRNALKTEETTALEPAVLDAKYYVRGIGEVAEVSQRGPTEALRLVEIIR
jgi:hypothetical protein